METNYSSGVPGMNESENKEHRAARSESDVYSGSGTAGEPGSGSLREELTNLKSDLDTLLSRASSLTDRQLKEARDRLMSKFGSMRHSAKNMASDYKNIASDYSHQLGEQFSHGMDTTADYVRDKPLQSIAIAAGVGLLLGAMLRRND